MERNLTVANCGDVCTFETVRAKTIVDITVTNVHAERCGGVLDWRVDEETDSNSNHKYITFSLGEVEVMKKWARNWRRLNKGQFGQLLLPPNEELPNVTGNLEEAACVCWNNIQLVLDRLVPSP